MTYICRRHTGHVTRANGNIERLMDVGMRVCRQRWLLTYVSTWLNGEISFCREIKLAADAQQKRRASAVSATSARNALYLSVLLNNSEPFIATVKHKRVFDNDVVNKFKFYITLHRKESWPGTGLRRGQGRNHFFKLGGPMPWSMVLPPFYRKNRQFGAVGYIITLYSSKNYVKSWRSVQILGRSGSPNPQWLRP